MVRGDSATAQRYLDTILTKQPGFVPALILKSKLLISLGRPGDAAQMLEESLKAPGDPDARLFALKDLYGKAIDRPNYRRTVVRLAAAKPREINRLLDYADLLYDEEQRDAAYAITRRLAKLRPNDIRLASAILGLWMKFGDAMPVDDIASNAAGTSPVMRAAYAQYANEIGRPDIALAILGPSTLADAPNQNNSDAKAAYAYATGLRGQRAEAIAQLDAILTVDPTQPRALIARARLRSNVATGIEDARQVVADDSTNMVARLTLANLMMRQNDAVLAENTLRAGLKGNNGDTRAVLPLVRLLRAQGRRESADVVIAEFVRAYPFSLRAARLRAALS